MATRTCDAATLAYLLNLVDGVILDETPVPCPNSVAWVTTVERGIGAYAAVCDAHHLLLRLDPGHVRSVPLITRTS